MGWTYPTFFPLSTLLLLQESPPLRENIPLRTQKTTFSPVPKKLECSSINKTIGRSAVYETDWALENPIDCPIQTVETCR